MSYSTLVERKRILITVKTYPTLSNKYDELVCTAGITLEGKWIRLYPIPFRKLDFENQYKKYQWIEVDVVKNTADPRPESYRPLNLDNLQILEHLDTSNKWSLRKEAVFKAGVHTNFQHLIDLNKETDDKISIALFKPTEVLDLEITATEREWDAKKVKAIEAKAKQQNLFGDGGENPFKLMPKLPYEFRYVFKDETGQVRRLMIEDWEIGQLYWNCLKSSVSEEACQKVKQKYFDEFIKTDLYFYVGTRRNHDGWTHNPFLIIGAFWPPIDNRQPLF